MTTATTEHGAPRAPLGAFVPQDRRSALVAGADLPDRTDGAALFADLSGFTALTERLARTLGPLRGAEELSQVLRDVYGALIGEVERAGGSVLGFSGDAITCWFDGDDGSAAIGAAHGMQRCMAALGDRPLHGGGVASLRVKTAVAVGPVRRFAVGDPDIQRMDVIAGATLDTLAAAEHAAEPGDVIVALDGAPPGLDVAETRHTPDGQALARVAPQAVPVAPDRPPVELGDDLAAPWVLRTVRQRLRHSLGGFLAGFRPAAALFLSFRGIDYDDDAEAGDKLDAYVRWAQRVVDDHGGNLVQLTIGDKGSYLYAAFGAPVAHDDDGGRAVAAARMLVAPPQPYVREVRIGLTHGQMFTGAYGSSTRCTYGVLGPMTNLAARLMGKAADGEILCSRELARQASRRWRFEERPAVTVKGVSDPVPVFVPLGEAAGGRGGSAPLFGRARERTRLCETIYAARIGRMAGALLEGEPGQGKTRLLDALADEAEADGLAVLRGAGRSLGQDATYGAWRDVVQDALGLRGEGLGIRAVSAALQGFEPPLDHELAALDDVLALGVQPRLTAEGTERRQLVTAAVGALLAARARLAPLAIVLDDAHALDSLSWELLDELWLRFQRERTPVALVLARRPGEGHEASLFADVDRVPLPPLGGDDVLELAAARLGLEPDGLPPSLREILRDRAGGNPLVVEGLLDHLRSEGALRLEDGSDECVLDETSHVLATVPQTLRGLLLSSIDRQTPEAQLTLKAAAVVGREFETPPLTDALANVAEFEASAGLQQVQGLAEDGFVDALPSPETYRFRQALTHEVAYETLLFAQRRRFHGRLAQWWRDHGGADPTALAHHTYHAAEGTDDPELIGHAADAQAVHTRHLLELGAYVEATTVAERGLALLPDAPRWATHRAKLLVYLGEVQQQLSAYDDAKRNLLAGFELARSATATGIMAGALNSLAMVATRQGNFDEALRYGAESLEHSRSTADEASEGRASTILGMLANYRGELDDAFERFTAAANLAERVGDRAQVASNVSNLGIVRVYQERYADARPLFQRALHLAEQLGNRHIVARFVGNLGLVDENLGNLDAAEEEYRSSRAIFEELGARQEATTAALNLAEVAMLRGNESEARLAYGQALRDGLALGAVPVALSAVAGLAWVYVREGNAARAAELVAASLAHPASDAEVERRASMVLNLAKAMLTAETLEAHSETGRATSLEDVARSEVASL